MAARVIDPEARRVGLILRSIREQQKLTQLTVATALGKKEGAYAAYEAGRSRFTLPELPRVAMALEVTTAYLATRLGFCGEGSADIATALVQRFGPEVGGALIRLDRVLAQLEHGDEVALSVLVRNTVSKYERAQR